MAVEEEHHSHEWYERALNLISVVKPGEGKSCLLLSLNAAVLMACFYLLKVIREPLILSYGGAEFKSYATAYQALVLMALVPLFSYFYHRFSDSDVRSLITNRVLLFFTSNLIIFTVLQFLGINIGMAFYVWLGIFSVMVIAQFWAFAADSYNVRCGQRLFVILAVGATFGSWLGSKLAGPIFPYIGIVGIMILATVLLLFSIVLTHRTPATIPIAALNNESPKDDDSLNKWLDGFTVVFQSRYLMLIASFVMILVFINSTGEYILARLVQEQSVSLYDPSNKAAIEIWQGQFYSTYYSWITLGSFVLQLFVVSRLISWIGLRGSVLILPGIMIIGYGMMMFFPIFSVIRYVMTMENSANYSIQNTTRHALFLPVPRKQKYLGKTTIETFFYRLGDLFYGGFIFVSTQYFDLPISAFIISNLILAVFLFGLAIRVGYHNTLAKQKVFGNSAPELMASLPHLNMPMGKTSKFSISSDTFVDPDIGDALTYHAEQESGKPLPKWIQFDRISRTFAFNPPEDHSDTYVIKVVATDYEGLTAACTLEVSFFKPKPQNA